jgi:pyruvate,water dikinase
VVTLTHDPKLDDPALVPIIEKKRGEKARKMVYAAGGERPTRNVPTSEAERLAFVLDDAEILQLARWACVIEGHYGMPMDMEWAKDGQTREVHRPGTTRDRPIARSGHAWSYRVKSKGRTLATGLSIGDAVVAGPVCVIDSPRAIDRFVDGRCS